MNLIVIPEDKANHAIYGALVCLAVGFLAGALVGLLAAVLMGAAKEGADYLLNLQAKRSGALPLHGVELLDLVATSAGGLVVYLAMSA